MKQFWSLNEKIRYQGVVGYIQFINVKKKTFFGSFRDQFNKEFVVEFDFNGFSTCAGKELNLKAEKETK